MHNKQEFMGFEDRMSKDYNDTLVSHVQFVC